MTIHVYIDTREPPKTAQYFRGKGFEVTEQCLDIGDILAGDVIFELKSVSDLVGSIQGRMWEQAEAMQGYDKKFLLVHGDFSQIHKWNINSAIDGLASLSVRYNLEILFFPNRSAGLYFVQSVIKKKFDGREMQAIFVKKISKKEVGLGIIMALPNISQKRAQALLDKFGSPANVFNIFMNDSNKVLELPGFGKRIVQKICDGLNQKY